MKTLSAMVSALALAISLFETTQLDCKEVSEEQAMQIALSWMAKEFDTQALPGGKSGNLLSVDIERNSRVIAYLFQIEKGGFVLVAADDEVGRIIAFSETSKFDADIPPIRKFLDTVNTVMTNNVTRVGEKAGHASKSTMSQSFGILGPLIKTIWNQGWPYNKYCPTTYYTDSSCKYCYECEDANGNSDTPAGCVAVAMAQIMAYHQSPMRAIGSHEYDWYCESVKADCTACTGYCEITQIYANFAAVNYDWANMATTLDIYSSDAEIEAVSRLIYHCGVAVDMDYGCCGSAAYSTDARDALRTYFDYESSAEYVGRDFTSDQWFQMLGEEIRNNRPVYYDASWTGAHAFVLDGVDDTRGDTLYVHLNYGWGGASNGWYDLNFFYEYTLDHDVLLNISPRTPAGGGEPSSPTSPGGPAPSSSGCAIATAAWGTPLAEEVKILSEFRDKFLGGNVPGRLVIRIYYNISPHIAKSMKNRPLIRKFIRLQLKPIVFFAKLFVLHDAQEK